MHLCTVLNAKIARTRIYYPHARLPALRKDSSVLPRGVCARGEAGRRVRVGHSRTHTMPKQVNQIRRTTIGRVFKQAIRAYLCLSHPPAHSFTCARTPVLVYSMAKRPRIGVIGGSGLYQMEGLEFLRCAFSVNEFSV